MTASDRAILSAKWHRLGGLNDRRDNLQKVSAGAFELSNPPGDKDPEFDIQGHTAPRLGNHSWRRYADKRAKQEMEWLKSLGLSKMTIDRLLRLEP